MADVYERRGAPAAAAVVARVEGEGRLGFWLYAPDGRLLAGANPPASASEAIARALGQDEDVERVVSRDRSILARRTTSESGAAYIVVWEGPGPWRRFAQLSPLRFVGRLTALLVTSAAICLLLTWQITRPITALRSAARRFADGDLGARVGAAGHAGRGDELSELAREFDRMASRIEGLIRSQQQLLGDISHELRSPLARLSLALDLARRRLGDDVPEHARMEQEVHRLNALIGQLLTLARLRASQPTFERLNLRDLVRDVVNDARFEAESVGKAVKVEHEVAADVLGDRALLRSAIDNVIRNAIRYTPEGSAVSIALEATDGAGHAAIVVRDHGPGVAPAMLARLFDPFFRVESARDRESGGAGLGLAITRQAMTTHGGHASARNHPEGGLEVRLDLPATNPDKS